VIGRAPHVCALTYSGFNERVPSALRHEFGGHVEKPSGAEPAAT
jgi:6-phosphogluconate dehydrogenase (decarboxylating)